MIYFLLTKSLKKEYSLFEIEEIVLKESNGKEKFSLGLKNGRTRFLYLSVEEFRSLKEGLKETNLFGS